MILKLVSPSSRRIPTSEVIGSLADVTSHEFEIMGRAITNTNDWLTRVMPEVAVLDLNYALERGNPPRIIVSLIKAESDSERSGNFTHYETMARLGQNELSLTILGQKLTVYSSVMTGEFRRLFLHSLGPNHVKSTNLGQSAYLS